MNTAGRGAVAGAAGATAWALADPLLARSLGTSFTDVRFAGRLVPAGRLRPVAGVAVHTAFGTALGAALAAAGLTTPLRALLGAQAENLAAWPGLALADRRRPGRGEGSRPRRLTNGRVFIQSATARLLYAVWFVYAFERLG